MKKPRSDGSHLVEVDVHALQLEVGGAIVTILRVRRPNPLPIVDQLRGVKKLHLHTGAVKAVLARDGLPVELLDVFLDR